MIRALSVCCTLLAFGASSVAVAQTFDGRVTVGIRESWWGIPKPGLPRLRLTLATLRQYPTTGYCLDADSTVSGDTLRVTLKGVSECGMIAGDMVSPAYHLYPLGRSDSLPALPKVLALVFRGATDRYLIRTTPWSLRMEPIPPPHFSALTDSAGFAFVEPNTLQISCFGQFMQRCTCDQFLVTALFRGHMTGYASPYGPSLLSPRVSVADTSEPMRRRQFIAREGIRLDSLTALAADFTRVFDGGNAESEYSPMLWVQFHLWDGRRVTCGRGKCGEDFPGY